jgi:hypothetical protein
MIKYIIVHCKHNGCYDYGYYEEEKTGKRIKPIVTINPPKIFLFDNKPQAKEFFDEYINDVDVLDERCVNGEHINHVDYCTCGIVELDEEDGQPIFFYNHRNQIFLLETGPQLFVTPHNLKIDLNNMNLTNSLIKKSKYLGREQKLRYIELGKRCQEYMKRRSYVEEVDDEEDGEAEDICQPCAPDNKKDETDNQDNQDNQGDHDNQNENKDNVDDNNNKEDSEDSEDNKDINSNKDNISNNKNEKDKKGKKDNKKTSKKNKK